MTYHLGRSKTRALAIGVPFVLLAAATIVAYALSNSRLTRHAGTQPQRQSAGQKAYKMVSQEIFTGAGEQRSNLIATKVRYQKSSGDWKEVTRYFSPEGKLKSRHAVFGIGGRGVLSVNEGSQSLDYISPMPLSSSLGGNEEAVNERSRELRADPHFVREETVLGRSAAVLRFQQRGSGTGYYVEAYYAPSLDSFTPIKEVFVNEAGTTVVDPVLIKPVEPTPREFGQLPSWPLAFGLYERKIQSAEDAGRPDIAAAMRDRIEVERRKAGI